MKKINILLIIIFVAAFVVRFYNFPNRVTFWSEQARSLIVSAGYLSKPSFLGQEYFIRRDTSGHTIFSGALFNYSLVPLLFLGNWDPVKITVFFALLNITTGAVIFLTVRKMFGQAAAIFSAILFLFNDFMIYHSLFIWIYNYLPLIGMLTIYVLWLDFKKSKTKYVLWAGLLSGIGISLQILFVPFSLLVLVFCLRKSKRKLVDLAVFIAGNILGNLPMIIFDVRHGFYDTITIWNYLVGTLSGRSNAGFSYYYLLPLWPLFATIGGLILLTVYKKNRIFALVVLFIYLFLNLTSGRISWQAPTGMPKGLTVGNVDNASKIIAENTNKDFNVAEVLDFDKRAYIFRYFVEYKYGKTPLGVEDYQSLKLLYVLAPTGFDFAGSDIWEVKSGGPYKVGLLSSVDGSYGLYKLSKNEN